MEKNSETQTNQENKTKFELQKIYLKEICCKVPQAPNFFLSSDFANGKWEPTFSIEIHVKHQAAAGNRHEIILHATISAKTKENTTAFTIDVQQAGLFLIENVASEQMMLLIKNQCSAMLYPYLSRIVAESSVQAGFPALLLPIPNYEPAKSEEIIEEGKQAPASGHSPIAQAKSASIN